MAGIYLHVPFCHSKCAYCDFYSIANPAKVDEYVNTVEQEYGQRVCELGSEMVSTLYFGGGTPSMLDTEHFSRLAGLLYSDSIEEFTIEVNPEDVTEDKVRLWCECGVNRVSIGVQSLIDEELRTVRRRHSAADALSAIKMLQDAGISNISGDLIYGLPGQTRQSWEYSLGTLLATGIKHLSAYCLSYEEGTLLYRMLCDGRINEMPDEETEYLYGLLCRRAAEAGFNHYEISNFALPGLHSRHNSNYWRGVAYLGLGPAAHSLDSVGIRRYNTAAVSEYINGCNAVGIVEAETDIDRVNDRIMTGLRTAEGIYLQDFKPEISCAILRQGMHWLETGHLHYIAEAGRVYIPEDKWLLADAVIRDLFVV